jgi:hypothetical protein
MFTNKNVEYKSNERLKYVCLILLIFLMITTLIHIYSFNKKEK